MDNLIVLNNNGYAININDVSSVNTIDIQDGYVSFSCYLKTNNKEVSFWYMFNEYDKTKQELIDDLTLARLELLKMINGNRPAIELLKFKKRA